MDVTVVIEATAIAGLVVHEVTPQAIAVVVVVVVAWTDPVAPLVLRLLLVVLGRNIITGTGSNRWSFTGGEIMVRSHADTPRLAGRSLVRIVAGRLAEERRRRIITSVRSTVVGKLNQASAGCGPFQIRSAASAACALFDGIASGAAAAAAAAFFCR